MATVVNTGLTAVAKLINGVDLLDPFTYMALDGSDTVEAAAQTALVTEITTFGCGRAAATCTYEADYKSQWVNTFTATGGAIAAKGVGVLNAAAVGIMLFRHVFDAVQNISDGGSLQVTASITYAQA